MAELMVGGAFLSASLQVLFDRLASREVLNLFSNRKTNVDGLLASLKRKLLLLDAVLDDADVKQFTNIHARSWSDEARDAVYQADDILSEITYEARRRQVESDPSSLGQVKNWFSNRLNSFDVNIGIKLKDILQLLDALLQEACALGLKEGARRGANMPPSRSSSSLVVDVYGRESEKKQLIDRLLQLNETSVDVIPVVGMGGMGKTPLAQQAYHDRSVHEHFATKAWVPVSQVFDVPRVTKTLLESISGRICRFTDLNQVQESLKKELNGKKFLVVLDDVWNLTNHEWDYFRAPFRSGAPGSKIIVTTRLQNTADIMRTGPVINLAELSDDFSWSLFADIAFGERDPSSYPHLEEIGRKIVKRCRGLPLAVKSLASLLRSKPLDVGEWEDVLKSEIWDLTEDVILRALRLSYHHLPSHLKQCFAFCSLFPKNYPFEEEKMASLWIAQKFVLPRKGKSYELEGKKCFRELLSMSFFQQLGSTKDYPYFVMHDLIHDLAQVVSGEFAFRLDGGPQEEIPGKVDGGKQKEITGKVRHCSYEVKQKEIPGKVGHCSYEVKGLQQLQAPTEVKHLRTFLPVSITLRHQRWDGLDVKVLSRQKHMRVLSLPGYSKINDLADLVGSLIHLQYLDLSGTDMQQLPESICKLYNLETLLLVWCDSLTNLPADIGKLISLRQLNITGTNLTEMPKQMSQLKRLEYLSTFVVGKESGLAIGGLKAMSNLKGKLQISGLENVRDKKDALEAKLVEKEHLEMLTLEWGGVTDDSQHEREVLDNLHPHTNLKGLGIRNYGGTMFPDWMGSNLFNQMVSLRLEDCQNCVFMPPLGQLPCLKELVVQGMTSVVEVGQEFLGNSAGGNQPFPSLEALLFKDMLEWVIWHLPGEGEFPKLRKFEMINCPSFVGTLPEKDIANISIARCPSLASVPCSSSDEKQVDVVAKEPRFQSKHAWQAALQELKTNHSSNVEEGGSKAMIHLIWNHIDPITKLCLRWVVSHSNRERLTATSMVSSWLADGLVQTQAEGEELSNDMIKSGLLVDHYSRGITLKKVFQDLLLKYVIRSLGSPSTARAIVDDAEIINLANSEVSALPDSPVCSQVVLLCLQSNRNIMVIPPLFFQHMPLLSTLNLSYTSIKTLPASISALVSLRKLRLRGCDLFLELPPEIGTLTDLEVIDLEGTRVTHLPDEIAQLQKLQSLKLSFYACGENHTGNTQRILEGLLLSSRNSLKELWIGADPDADGGAGAWIANIHSSSYKNLSSIALHVPDAELLGRDFISGKNYYKLIVGGNGQHMMSRIPSDIEEEFKQQTKLLKYVNGEHIPIEIMDTLRDSNAFILERHWTVKSLSEFGTGRMHLLKFCLLAECNELQTIFDGNYAIFNHIEYLYIYYMKNLRSIWSRQVTTSVDILWLKHLSLCTCMILDSVFSISLLGNLPNLEELVVEDCPKIESLVFQDCAWVHRERYFLPRLKKISLRELPELVSISNGIQIAPNLEKLVIFYCPKLGSISEVLGKKLKVVKGETEWWDSLSWKETDHLANIFVPLQKDGDLMAQFTQD